MSGYVNPEFKRLYDAYTDHERSIGADFRAMASDEARGDPLVVATATTMVLYPGDGAPPALLPFRKATRGFNELAAVSHLGPAVGSLVAMRLAGDGRWREDAAMLRMRLAEARAANSAELWRDRIAVDAFRGREEPIAAMLDYGCVLTDRLLATMIEDENRVDAEFLRRAYLEASDDALGATVPFNHVMIATFFLVGMDIAYRANSCFAASGVDWRRAMVLIAGQQGRPTAGVTLSSNSIAQIVLAASGGALALDRIYIAPHAPTFATDGPDDLEPARRLEQPLRDLWAFTHALQRLAGTMFEGWPRYDPASAAPPHLHSGTERLAEMPAIEGPDDMRAMTTRLRLVMEDPRQLLSGCVTDYAARQLAETGNDPAEVVVPGLDGVAYPLPPSRPGVSA